MPSPHAAINPLLISTLKRQPLSSIPEKPTVSLLPGILTKIITRYKKKIDLQFESNKQVLICGHCGSKGQYDIGFVAFNLERWQKDEKDSSFKSQPYQRDMMDYVQTTGYIRCKQCNGAGNWKAKDLFSMFGLLTRLFAEGKEDKSSYMAGEIALYDGSTPKWATDAEENFLNKLRENVQDGFLWNRLGNLYLKGGRPELAAAAYEKSIQVDPSQVESHYSLGRLLFQVDELEKSAYHSRMMLVYARHYPKMAILDLREILAIGLQNLYDIHVESDRKIAFMPTKEELEVLNSFKEVAAGSEPPTLSLVDLEVFPDDRKSFYPVAEMYMWLRKDEIPASERTLDQYLPEKRKQIVTRAGGHSATDLGTDSKPVVIRVRSEERAEKIYQLCERYELQCIIGIEYVEDLSDLRKALMQKLSPSNVYVPCLCGSGLKYKFCCGNKLKNFDLERFIEENGTGGGAK
ncbi:tetratricopeptide repeat protein [Paenibacillus sp. GP183]|uniref:tetratricopeptide repeat protein n=1 Tax=Paenibacillus sp. GP183 TaxID=1882751 RepID=UPI0008956113|nr:tetratricopeptide repeat protein [Paenibacillus sp. GP183]SEC44138.1 TPR repeat-containing protein [Paenibacillus sp. GP183]